MDGKLVTTLLLGALVLWALYRRVRRTFGRQPVNVARLGIRVTVLSVLGALLLFSARRTLQPLEALLGGIAGGAALGVLGLRHTKFEVTPQGRFYTPHTYIGLFLTALFLGRLIFRYHAVHPDTLAGSQPMQGPLAGLQNSPLTLAVFGLPIGYYVLFNLGVLKKSRELATPSTDSPPL